VALVNATNGVVVAEYEYGAFHELIRATGPLATLNPFLAATKFYDWETGLYYYGYRYYNPNTGRWLNRDPLEEDGGVNVYGFVANDAINSFDYLGLKGNGHHLVPWSIFNGAVKEEVQKFFDSDLSRIFNDYYKNHNGRTLDNITGPQYTKLVSEELEKFLGKTALKDMTVKQAEQFLNQIKNAPANSPIRIYNNAVRREAATAMKKALKDAAEKAAASSLKKVVGAGAKKSGAKLAKAIPLVGAVVAVYFYAEDA
jgi:RHS repeat-associated protein